MITRAVVLLALSHCVSCQPPVKLARYNDGEAFCYNHGAGASPPTPPPTSFKKEEPLPLIGDLHSRLQPFKLDLYTRLPGNILKRVGYRIKGPGIEHGPLGEFLLFNENFSSFLMRQSYYRNYNLPDDLPNSLYHYEVVEDFRDATLEEVNTEILSNQGVIREESVEIGRICDTFNHVIFDMVMDRYVMRMTGTDHETLVEMREGFDLPLENVYRAGVSTLHDHYNRRSQAQENLFFLLRRRTCILDGRQFQSHLRERNIPTLQFQASYFIRRPTTEEIMWIRNPRDELPNLCLPQFTQIQPIQENGWASVHSRELFDHVVRNFVESTRTDDPMQDAAYDDLENQDETSDQFAVLYPAFDAILPSTFLPGFRPASFQGLISAFWLSYMAENYFLYTHDSKKKKRNTEGRTFQCKFNFQLKYFEQDFKRLQRMFP